MKKIFFTKILPIVIVLGICFFAIRSLFVPGFFTMHDDEQIARLSEMHVSLVSGQWPPRWTPRLGFGYGYPLFNFYPPLVYYAGELFYVLGFSLINATKIVMALGFLLSALFMYLWVSKRYGKTAGIVAGALYTYAPYHGVDLYVRGAFAEFFSFVWIPAIFWTLDNAVTKKSYGWGMLSGIFLSFLVLTHNLTALACIPFFIIYLGVLIYQNKVSLRQLIPIVIITGVTALGLSAYFWLPSLLEKKDTIVDQILTKELASYTIHFVYPMQLWNSPWGYGGSIPGPIDGLSFQVGKLHLILALIAFFILIFMFLRKKKITIPATAFILFIFSLFMTLTWSEWIWNLIQPLWYIQFPWRFLVFTVAFASFLGGYVVYVAQKYMHRNAVYAMCILIIGASILLVGKYFQPQKYLHVTDDFYTVYNDIEWRVSQMSYEYAPHGIATVIKDGTTHLTIQEHTTPRVPATVLSKNTKITTLLDKVQDKQFQVTSQNGAVLQFTLFSFPGWKTFIDGKQVPYSDNNKLKLIVLSVPKGEHMVRVVFTDTPVRTIGDIISGVTLWGLVIYFLFVFLRTFKKK